MRCMQMSEGLTTADINPGDNGRSFVIETAAVCTAPHSYVCLLHPTVMYLIVKFCHAIHNPSSAVPRLGCLQPPLTCHWVMAKPVHTASLMRSQLNMRN